MVEWRIGDQSAGRDGTAADLEVVGPLGGGDALPGAGCDLVEFRDARRCTTNGAVGGGRTTRIVSNF